LQYSQSILYFLMNKVILNINMFSSCMKYRVQVGECPTMSNISNFLYIPGNDKEGMWFGRKY
jgi:hypothetical protein